MTKILVTPRSVSKNGHPALARLEAAGYAVVFCRPGVQPSEQDLLAALPGCVGMLAGVEPIGATVLESAGQLKAISRNGVGVNNIDLDAAARLQIKVLNTPGANARGVAELTWGLLLSVVRSVAFGDAGFKSQQWQRRKGVELEGKTLGLVGCGNIGKLVAGYALAFGMKVLAYDPFADPAFTPSEAFGYASLETVLAGSDVVSLHCPPAKDGAPLIDAASIATMKTGVYVINTARAELLDDAAVLAALNSGQIAGLGLDVFTPEPPTDWSLAQHPHTVATAHIGGFTDESVDRAVSMAVDNLLDALT